jgi:hypothetical protein
MQCEFTRRESSTRRESIVVLIRHGAYTTDFERDIQIRCAIRFLYYIITGRSRPHFLISSQVEGDNWCVEVSVLQLLLTKKNHIQ